MSDDLTLEQRLAELREFEERISCSYGQLYQLLATLCEELKQHSDVVQEFRQGILRWFEEREQKFAQSRNLKVG